MLEPRSTTSDLSDSTSRVSDHAAEANRAGWVNVVAASVLMLATLPGRTQGLGLITEPMLRDLGLDRVGYATVNLWATLLGAAICLPIGRVFDSLGLRIATAAIVVSLSLVVWLMSGMTGGVMTLFVLVLATRALGQSALSISSITVVGKSFDRNVGVAMGVYSVLLTILFAAAFTWVGTSVRVDGWRTAWAAVAVGLIVVGLPAALAIRERFTTAAGTTITATKRVDGGHRAGDVSEDRASLDLAAALRTPAFWVFAVATSLFGLASSGLGLFNEAVLAERGFDQQTYVNFLAGSTIVGLVGQLGCGWLTLRWSMQRLLGIALLLYAAALTVIPLITTMSQLWALAALVGLSGGMITVIFFAVWRHAFGVRHLGRIQGAAQMLTVLASAIGPLLFAQSANRAGSYFPALWILAPCVLLLGVAAFRVTLPAVGDGR